MNRVLYVLIAFVVLVIAGIASLPFLMGGEFAANQLSARLEQATGRKLTLLKAPHLQFLPELAIKVEGISISNPAEMFDGAVVAADSLEIKMNWSDVLTRTINLQSITLVKPRLNLVIDAQGRANWSLGKSSQGDAATAPKPNTEMAFRFAPVEVKDGVLILLDERSGTTFKAEQVNMTVSMANINAPASVAGSLVWRGQKVNLQVFVKSPSDLAGRGSAADVAIQSRALNAAISGLAGLDKGLKLAGKVDASSPDLRALAKWAGVGGSGTAGLKDFSVQAGLDLANGKVELKDAFISMDGMKAQGSATVDPGSNKPHIEASLGIDQLNTNIYTGKKSAGITTAQPDDGWSDEAFDLSGLNIANAKLRLSASSILYGDVKFGATRLNIDLIDGKLEVALKETIAYGGRANGTLQIDGTSTIPTLSGTFLADKLDGAGLLKDFAGFSRFDGMFSTKLDLSATGQSQRELVSTLKGSAILELNNGLLRGIDLASMIGSVRKNVLEGWSKTDNAGTEVNSMSASFKIADGIAQTSDLNVLSPAFQATGDGSVDMLRRHLDFRTKPVIATGVGNEFAGLAVPVIVTGRWSNPKVYPDVAGILENPDAAFKTLNQLDLIKGDIKVEAAGKTLGSMARQELQKALGDEGAKEVEDAGKSLLKQLFKQPKQ